MPTLDDAFWEARLREGSTSRYADPWADRYIEFLWKRGLARVWLPEWKDVLDVGCGDAYLDGWLRKRYGVRVTGIDAHLWPHAAERLDVFLKKDASEILAFAPRQFDVAMTTAVLSFVADWQFVFLSMAAVARHVLVLDNLQFPVPKWQEGLSYKQPLTWVDVFQVAKQTGFHLVAWYPVTVLDRRLFRHLPGPLAFVLSTMGDVLLTSGSRRPWNARQQIAVWRSPDVPSD